MSSNEFLNSWDINIKDEYKELYHELLTLSACKGIKNNENYYNVDTIGYVLDTKKNFFSLIEKMVYDIAMFHFKRLNIIFDEKKHDVEYWFVNRNHNGNNLHIDCDETIRIKYKCGITPILSTITYCSKVNYKNNSSNNPTLITNIQENNSMNFIKNNLHLYNKFYFSFPKFLKHISFEGGKYYHGAFDLCGEDVNNDYSERILLAVGLWDKKTTNNYGDIFKNSELAEKYLQTIPKHEIVVNFKKYLNNKIIVCKEEETNHRFFKLNNKKVFENIRFFIKNPKYIFGLNDFTYRMDLNQKEILDFFKKKIEENNEYGLCDNFCFHFI